MAQVKTKSSIVAQRPVVARKMSEFTKHFSAPQKSTVMRAAKVLAQLSPSQRSELFALLQMRSGNGGLDYNWLTSLFTVLRKLKAQETGLHPH
jgi:hypothetical protein